MADWGVLLYEAADGERVVLEEIQALGHDASTDIIRAARKLCLAGLELRAPLVKPIEGKIWELRPDRYRVLYFATMGQRFILLRAFIKKTSKTPKGHIAMARRRMDDYLARHGGGE